MVEQDIGALREEFKQKLSRLNDYLWGGGLKDPVSRIQQISFFFFLKMLEEQDIAMETQERLTGIAHKSIFEGEDEKFRWSNWIHKTGKDLYNFVRDEVFVFVEELHNSHETIRQVFHGAKLLIPDEVTLKRTLEIIDTIDFALLDTDVKGDLYEDLLNQIEAAGELGQFLTPRRIIRFIVEMVNPKIGQTVYDPACGSGGFLITSYEWIKLNNSDTNLIEERNGQKRGYGDRLSKEQWDFLQKSTFYGQDVDPEMTRLCLMNLILHGIEGANIKRKDTVAGAEDEDDLRRFDCVLTNPPFAGKVDKERIKKSLPIKSTKTQILLLGHVIDSLNPGGRAGIILPEGTLFGTNRDDKEIRRYLLENANLEAVVSMPGGVFEPYSGVKTSVLIFCKGKPTEEVWFYDLKGDGSSLSKAHKFGPQYCNDIPDLLTKWPNREGSDQSWEVPVKEIIENDYILSANAYNPNIGGEEKEHRDPKEILREIEENKSQLNSQIKNIKGLLG
ncbi:MAG: N-6 DNA methylase [Actinomycetota bacterium]|nr:N-6 DNA methylase [Actinomycetota bacterium]